MREPYHLLNQVVLDAGAVIARPRAAATVTLDSPAIAVMTDFRRVRAVSIDAHASIDMALAVMRYAQVRLLLVTSGDDRLSGLITARDIEGEKPIRIARDTGQSHKDITVGAVMTPRASITALPLISVERWRVGHIVATLRYLERQHTLVVDTAANGGQRVCGLFSTTQIGRQLGEDVDIVQASAHTLAELQHDMR